MKATLPLLWLGWLSFAGCASLSPADHAAAVKALPGQKPLRVGVVVLSTDTALQEAFAEPPAAPGGGGATAPAGAIYAERIVLPASLPADVVGDSLAELGAFTDVVRLPFDCRGIASREGLLQRVQDRLWPTAIAQELDALLVIEGVRDRGLCWTGADESLVSLDTVLWWLAWPFGLWIPDRSYAPDVGIAAELFWLGDVSATPQPVVLDATVPARALAPVQRAETPLLGLVLPGAWLADDPHAVNAATGEWARAMLPVSLVQTIKQLPLPLPGDVRIALAPAGDRLELRIDSPQEVTEASLCAVPRGALTAATVPAPLAVSLTTRIEPGTHGPRHVSRGGVARADVVRDGCPLLRVRATLASGEQVSCTWSLAAVTR